MCEQAVPVGVRVLTDMGRLASCQVLAAIKPRIVCQITLILALLSGFVVTARMWAPVSCVTLAQELNWYH